MSITEVITQCQVVGADWLIRSVGPDEPDRSPAKFFVHINQHALRNEAGALLGFKISAPVWGENLNETATRSFAQFCALKEQFDAE